MIAIREATAAHEDAAVALWAEAGLTRPWNPPREDFARAIAGSTSTVLVAIDGDALVGTAMIGADGHRGWMYYLAVAASHRGQGLGRQLVRESEQWLAVHAPKVQLMVRGDNAAVIDFYIALGYERQDTVVLGRRLDGA